MTHTKPAECAAVAFRDASGELHVYTAEAFAAASEHVQLGAELRLVRRDVQRDWSWNTTLARRLRITFA